MVRSVGVEVDAGEPEAGGGELGRGGEVVGLRPQTGQAVLAGALDHPVDEGGAEVDALLSEEISRRRSAPDLEERSDILSMLVTARRADGTALTDKELRDQCMTLLMAGHETTATALSWAIERLVREGLAARTRRAAEDRDRALLNRHATTLNAEMADVLDYQGDV